uniref:ENTH domain-containing protein n=1 Tax=Panagrolaimus superbus TaxID=310955 RepID=A0A914Y211_9BILA
MSEIAEDTKNAVFFQQIMQLIWQRLDEDQKQHRHIYKTLYLLEYLLKTGDEKVRIACLNNYQKIDKWRKFNHTENENGRGIENSKKAHAIIKIIENEEMFKHGRERYGKIRVRCLGNSSNMGPSTSSAPSSSKKTWKTEMKKRKSIEKAVEATKHFGEENAYQLAVALSEKEKEEIEHILEQEDEMIKIAIEESKNDLMEARPFEDTHERPFSPPPILTSLPPQQQELNTIEDISNAIMSLNFHLPQPPPPTFNDSFYKIERNPNLSSSFKNLPDLTTDFVPFASANNSIGTSSSLLSPPLNQVPDFPDDQFQVQSSKDIKKTPHYENIPDLSAYEFEAASKNSMHTSASANYLPELTVDSPAPAASTAPTATATSLNNVSLNPFINCSSNNDNDSLWDFGFVAPPSKMNDPWSSLSTTTTNFDYFNSDTVAPSSSAYVPKCSSAEAYQKMDKDFQAFNLSSQKYGESSEAPSSTNPFLNDPFFIDDRQYSRNNPFI